MNTAGHGCPPGPSPTTLVLWEGSLRAVAERVLPFLLALAMTLTLASEPIRAVTETTAEVNNAPSSVAMETRVVWGGGAMRTFSGSMSISKGTIEVVRNLSVQDDAVGTLKRLTPNKISIIGHSPSTFGGADIYIKSPLDAELEFQLDDPNGGPPPEAIRVPISKVVQDRDIRTIDARGSRLAVERHAHDRIRASLNQQQTIFNIGDHPTLTVEGYRCGLPAGEYRLHVRMVERGTQRQLAQLQRDIDIDETGSFAQQTFKDLDLPSHTAVMAIEMSIQRRRLINAFLSSIGTNERVLECVVLDKAPPPAGSTQWRSLSQIYPTETSWWDQLGKFRIPTVKTLTPLVSHTARPIGSGEHQRRVIDSQECMVLGKGAWQAFPITVESTGAVHRLTVRVPADQPQKLVFSIQEPTAAIDATGLRLDSGMLVEPSSVRDGTFLKHELVFWPKTSQPYLLVYNPDTQRDAAIAEIDLETASHGLLSPSRISEGITGASRLCALYFDKPLLTENFGAGRRLDSKTQRELDSWETMLTAAGRLADYTQWSGFNAAVVTIATQGGAIYPSTTLQPSRKFDSGIFLSDGSSPDIKDTAELIYREFDRRGLKLVVALELESLVPELDRFEDGPEANSPIEQVDMDGRTIVLKENAATRRQRYFNPLDSRVQQSLTRVLREVLDRYSSHPSFAGIQLNLSDRTPFNFAGDMWGYDNAALARFEKSLGSALPKSIDERKQLFAGPLRLHFIQDRAQQLASFYSKLADEVSSKKSDARLIINPVGLVASPPASDRFWAAQTQPLSASEVLMGCGIDCTRLSSHEKICVLRPEADSPLRTPASRSWSLSLTADPQLDSLMSGPNAGAVIEQMPTNFRLADFEKANLFNSANPRTWLFPHTSSAGAAARRNLCGRLFHADTMILENGGWLSLMGQENETRPFAQVLTKLPGLPMKDVATPKASPTLKVRQLEHHGHTYVQIINNSSWSETVAIEVRSAQAARVLSLGSATDESQTLVENSKTTLQWTLEPYSLRGLDIDATGLEFVNVLTTHEPGLESRMEQRLTALQNVIDRAGELNEQQTLGLRGGDFEEWATDGKAAGWTMASHPSTSISQERELPRSGTSCIRIENRANGAATAWIQSDRIAIPSTGRLALEAWVRTAPGAAQPTVRLSLIGRYRDGKRYQRWHEFTASQNEGNRIAIDWGRKPLVLLVPDVPNEELSELHVALDLVGPGLLWVDDIRVYGMYLHPEEKVHLLGQMFLAKEQLRKGDFTLADQLLESFWATYLGTYLTPTTPPTTQPTAPLNEARVPNRTSPSQPAWRGAGTPRFNAWPESWRGRWQR